MIRKSGRITQFTEHNKLTLVRGGREFFGLLEKLIQQAKHIIHFQTYIFEEDNTGRHIANALIAAAKREVEVHLLLDGFGSRFLSDEFIKSLTGAGVRFKFFHPLFKSRHFHFGRRLHHKIFVADNYYSLVGGINISNRYNDTASSPAWLDWAVYAEGEVSDQLAEVCSRRMKPDDADVPVKLPDDITRVRLRINDWVKNKKQITGAYVEMCRKAEERITIMSSYFLPGRVLKKNLRMASKRGVKISVVMTGKSDVAMMRNAEKYMYGWLLRKGIKIYEYQKNILHAKISVYDGKWVTVGSYNVNNISMYASIELNLEIDDNEFAENTEKILGKIIKEDCVPVTSELYGEKKVLLKRMVNRISYDIIRMLLFIFTFNYRQNPGMKS